MSKEELLTLIGAYFGEDFRQLGGNTIEEIVSAYKNDATPDQKIGAVEQIEKLIAMSEGDFSTLDQELEELGCGYYYPAVGLDSFTFLEKIRNLLSDRPRGAV